MTQHFSPAYGAGSPNSEPLPQEIRVFRDNNFTFTCEVRHHTTGETMDLMGWEAWFAVKGRDRYKDSEILIFKRTSDISEGKILFPTSEGRCEFYLQRADTRDLKEGVYFWDFGIFRVGDQQKITTAKGHLELLQPVLAGDPWSI
jgi:hypothetical protein